MHEEGKTGMARTGHVSGDATGLAGAGQVKKAKKDRISYVASRR